MLTPRPRRTELAGQALALRQAGHSTEVIAARLRITRKVAERALANALRQMERSRLALAEAARGLELDRLDSLTRLAYSVMVDVKAPIKRRLRAIDGLLAVHDRRVKVLGLALLEKGGR